MATRAWISLATGVLLSLMGCGGGGGSAAPPPVSPPPPPPPASAPTIDLQAAYVNLSFVRPVAMTQAPGDSTRWFVVEQTGRIDVFANDPNTLSEALFLDITDRVDASDQEAGLLGLAFHPQFPATPEVFVSYTATGPGGGVPYISRISRFLSLDGGLTLQAASEEILLTIDQDNVNHNGGDLKFGPDGFLYASFGDGGGGGDPNNNAQQSANLLGTIVRIDVDTGSPYAIPPSNVFAANAGSPCLTGVGGGACPEIFVWGLRNPWRFSFDSANGDLWIGDVGQNSWEEVNRAQGGENFGWRVREGAHCFNPASGCSTAFTDPVTEYDHSVGASITGGFVYRGSAVPDLVGWYVFGDFVSGRIFAIPADTPSFVAPTELLDTTIPIATFAQDSDGELFVVSYGGTISRIVDVP
ncbi:MAG: PQQ-dependent sugar dehydrogenase [Woeseiaceae bacterium]|nr:PQQ-dependent sugar dehydrogenase [Woeseiaceae bacterium]